MSADLIAELRSGLEGATPGPWRHSCPDRGYCSDYIVTDNPEAKDEQRHSDYVAETGNVTGPRGAKFFEKDAAHIARCSPDNIRTLLDHIAALESEREALRVALDEAQEDKARLDFLDRCNERLNARYGTTYRWELILNHNVNRLMLGHMDVDLNDAKAHGLRSCRDAIDGEMKRVAAARALTQGGGDGKGEGG